MKIIFLGSGQFATPVLEGLVEKGHCVLQVVTQPSRPAGRGHKTVKTPVAQTAEKLNLPILETPDVNAPDVAETLLALAPRVVVVVAFGQILRTPMIELAPLGAVNLHASLLPAYRGAAPIHWAIINAETETGLTTFRIASKVDAGEILLQQTVKIGPLETAGELHDQLARRGPELVARTLAGLEAGTLHPRPQPARPNGSTWPRAPKLTRADGRIDWNSPAKTIANRIRGLWPWPAVRCRYQPDPPRKDAAAQEVQLVRAEPVNDSPEGIEPGRFTPTLTVAARSGCVRIIEIRPASGRKMPFTDFARGRRIQPGDRLVL